MAFLTQRVAPKTTSLISILALFVFLPFLLFGAEQVAVLLTRAAGVKANIIIDTKTVLEPIQTNFYHAFAQGGEEAGDMLAPVKAETQALRPQVIRLDHLYDHYDVNVQSDGTISSWGKLDEAVSTILAMGAKPILALSYMPSAIAKDGVIINVPNDWNAWSKVVQQTIEHFSGRGARNINGIYYEVWNEPDLAQFGSWKYSGEKNYVTLYHYAAVGAGNAQNVSTFYLGGPATTGLYKSWIIALVNSGNRLDFLSWHTYQRDPLYYDRDQRNIITWLLPYPGYTLIPKLVTEFGFTGDKSTLYGTNYASAHAVAVIRQLITGGPTYLISFQPKDGPGQQSGNGWGLITHEDNGLKKKPRYFVYNFLDQMAGDRVNLRGEGSWVTGFASTKDGVIRVMLVNFSATGSHTESVPVTFDGLDPGTYTLRTRYFLGTDSKVTETVTGATLAKQIPMSSQSIVLLELSR